MPSSYTIGDHFESFVRDLVSTGQYVSASEVLRDGLRLLEQRQAQLDSLRAEIAKGAKGPFAPFDIDEILGDLRQPADDQDAA